MIQVNPYQRLIYTSRAVDSGDGDHLQAILTVSRRNNGMDGVSGVLWAKDGRYTQLLEGPADSVAQAFARIRIDPRHSDIAVLDDRMVDARQFGEWAMAGLPGDRPDMASERLRALLRNADAEIRRYFSVD
ncbi:BLUF domain-containing protein [Sphingomonas sp.]|uniref:BLUF domain-containing protein n=1 Tax=Sphingomonas sp. TaxID=28214 RepID=UPI0028A16705|nr:BLUF domain-containing protein [Sphingomonas sp.]